MTPLGEVNRHSQGKEVVDISIEVVKTSRSCDLSKTRDTVA